MGCKTEKTTIDGVEYSCTQFPAKLALTYKFRVIKILGPAISALAPMIAGDDGKKKSEDAENEAQQKQAEAIGSFVSKLFENSSPEELVNLMCEMISTQHTWRDKKRIDDNTITEHFSGDNLMGIYKVFFFVLKTNYPVFFKAQGITDVLSKIGEKL